MNKNEVLGIAMRQQIKTMNNTMNSQNSYKSMYFSSQNDYELAKKFKLFLEGKTDKLPSFDEVEETIKKIPSSGIMLVSLYNGLEVVRGPRDNNELFIDIYKKINLKALHRKRIKRNYYEESRINPDGTIKDLMVKVEDAENYDRIIQIQEYLKKMYEYKMISKNEEIGKYFNIKITEIDLSLREIKKLKKKGIETIRDVYFLEMQQRDELLNRKSFSIEKLKEKKYEIQKRKELQEKIKWLKIEDVILNEKIISKLKNINITNISQIIYEFDYTEINDLDEKELIEIKNSINSKRIINILKAKSLFNNPLIKDITFEDLKIENETIKKLKKYQILDTPKLIQIVLEDRLEKEISNKKLKEILKEKISFEIIDKILEEKHNKIKEAIQNNIGIAKNKEITEEIQHDEIKNEKTIEILEESNVEDTNNEIEKGENKMKKITTEEKLRIIKEYINKNGKNDINTNAEYNGYPIGKWILDVLYQEKSGKLSKNCPQEVIDEFKEIHETGNFKLKKDNKYASKKVKGKIKKDKVKEVKEKKQVKQEKIEDAFDLSTLITKLEIENENLKKVNADIRKRNSKEEEEIQEKEEIIKRFLEAKAINEQLKNEFQEISKAAEEYERRKNALTEEAKKLIKQ